MYSKRREGTSLLIDDEGWWDVGFGLAGSGWIRSDLIVLEVGVEVAYSCSVFVDGNGGIPDNQRPDRWVAWTPQDPALQALQAFCTSRIASLHPFSGRFVCPVWPTNPPLRQIGPEDQRHPMPFSKIQNLGIRRQTLLPLGRPYGFSLSVQSLPPLSLHHQLGGTRIAQASPSRVNAGSGLLAVTADHRLCPQFAVPPVS